MILCLGAPTTPTACNNSLGRQSQTKGDYPDGSLRSHGLSLTLTPVVRHLLVFLVYSCGFSLGLDLLATRREREMMGRKEAAG